MSCAIEPDVMRLLRGQIERQPHPILFATVSGAHIYGFASPDSDVDVRGAHILPLENVIGLAEPSETRESTNVVGGIEIDLVTHDVGKFFRMLLKSNGYVLEQALSPRVVHALPEFAELQAIAKTCATRWHAYHYKGFARNQWALFAKAEPARIKPLLYVYRVLLTGIHLMRSGDVQSDLRILAQEYGESFILELIDQKVCGHEHGTLQSVDRVWHEQKYRELYATLERAGEETNLPSSNESKSALNDLLIRLRLSKAERR